ncbi:MAG TPA: chemotaxis protein CheD [Anaerolineales bacterium]|nr:chemotaxis protein CheD [Anaerolineales bacterium]
MNEINVGLGEQAVSRNSGDTLVAYGLGSCVGVVMIDPVARVSGLLHAVLPRATDGLENGQSNASKYVESGIDGLIASMVKEGARKANLVVRIIGGANMLMPSGLTQSFNIGTRNIEAARATLNRLNLSIAVEEVGGHTGRTVRVYVADNRVTVRVIGEKEREI